MPSQDYALVGLGGSLGISILKSFQGDLVVFEDGCAGSSGLYAIPLFIFAFLLAAPAAWKSLLHKLAHSPFFQMSELRGYSGGWQTLCKRSDRKYTSIRLFSPSVIHSSFLLFKV